jgi:signal transduction histidine kinase
MNALISEVLTISKIDANRVTINPEQIDLNDILFNYAIEKNNRDVI